MLLFHLTILSKTTLPRWIQLFREPLWLRVKSAETKTCQCARRFCSLFARGVVLSICRTQSEMKAVSDMMGIVAFMQHCALLVEGDNTLSHSAAAERQS